MRDNAQFAKAGHRGKVSTHTWGDPVPGAGKLEVCTKCGARRTSVEENRPCDGLQDEAYEPTKHDYDPF